MRRPGLVVVAVAFIAALGVTLWLLREMRLAAATTGAVAVPLDAPGAPTAVAALAPAGAADHLPAEATATPGAPGAIEGVVAGPDGRPRAGVRVRLASRADGAAGLPPVEARSGFDGRFAFRGVEPGRAVVVAAQDGVALGTSVGVQVTGDKPAPATLVLAEPGVLEGAVRGAAPAAVVVVPLHPGPGDLQVARAAVDAGGAYRVSLPAGQYRVHAAPAALARADLRATPAFTAVAAGQATRLDLTAAAPAAESGAIVRVLEPGGRPAAGAAVSVSRAGEERVAIAAAAGQDGTLSLARDMGMAGQAVTVQARLGGRTGAFTGTLPERGEVVVQLRPGATVDVTVKGGGPVKAFTILIEVAPSPGAWRVRDRVELDGDGVLLADLPPGPLRLRAWTRDGRRAEPVERTAGPGERLAVVLALQPAPKAP